MDSKHVPVMLLYTVVLASLWCCCGTNQVSLDVRPGTSVFEGSFFVLKCVPEEQAADWRVYRNTSKHSMLCGQRWGKQLTNSCKVGLAVSWDTGLYWCQSTGGAVSNTVSITVTKDKLLVSVPPFPVSVGENVTLSCLDRSYLKVMALFYRDNLPLNSDPRHDLYLGGVSLSDRGSYKCSSGAMQSSPAHLEVHNHSELTTLLEQGRTESKTELPPTNSASKPDSTHTHLVLRLLFHLLVFCPYCISTVLMVSLYRRRPIESRRNAPK